MVGVTECLWNLGGRDRPEGAGVGGMGGRGGRAVRGGLSGGGMGIVTTRVRISGPNLNE